MSEPKRLSKAERRSFVETAKEGGTLVDSWFLRYEATVVALEQREQRARELLEVGIHKIGYLVRDYPDDKQSRRWIDEAAAYLSDHQEGE